MITSFAANTSRVPQKSNKKKLFFFSFIKTLKKGDWSDYIVWNHLPITTQLFSLIWICIALEGHRSQQPLCSSLQICWQWTPLTSDKNWIWRKVYYCSYRCILDLLCLHLFCFRKKKSSVPRAESSLFFSKVLFRTGLRCIRKH